MIYRPSALTEGTPLNIQLGAGAFFYEMDMSSVTPGTTAEEFAEMLEAARQEGKTLGATRGGGEFNVAPAFDTLEIDDMMFPLPGTVAVTGIEVTLSTTILEVRKENLRRILPMSFVDEATGALTMSATLLPEHYIKNLVWAGSMASGDLMAIEITKALNTAGLSMTMAPTGGGSIPVVYTAHVDDALNVQFAPFKIYEFNREGASMAVSQDSFVAPAQAKSYSPNDETNSRDY